MKKLGLLTVILGLALTALIFGCSSDSNSPKGGSGGTDNPNSTDDGGGEFLACDDVQDCWGDCYGCAITAPDTDGKEGKCYEVYQKCETDPTCKTIQECTNNSKDDAAYTKCFTDNGGEDSPAADKYYALDTCILCEACPHDCTADGSATPDDCK